MQIVFILSKHNTETILRKEENLKGMYISYQNISLVRI